MVVDREPRQGGERHRNADEGPDTRPRTAASITVPGLERPGWSDWMPESP